MLNVLEQLQMWAEEGRYNWIAQIFNWKGIEDFEIEWVNLVNLVLNNTIKVWRPVGKYEMTDEDYIMVRLNPDVKTKDAEGSCPYFIGIFDEGYSDDEFFLELPRKGHHMAIHLADAVLHCGERVGETDFVIDKNEITHWQHIPPEPKKVRLTYEVV
jgi:hypothetical protein